MINMKMVTKRALIPTRDKLISFGLMNQPQFHLLEKALNRLKQNRQTQLMTRARDAIDSDMVKYFKHN